MAKAPRLWMYKNRSNPEAYQKAHGDWEDFFDRWEATKQSVEWGGSWSTSLDHQKRVFQEEVKVGDLVLCWQTVRSVAVGVAEVTGIEDRSDGENELWLKGVERFPKPVRLHELKKSTYPELQQVTALTPGLIRTIYETTTQEAFWLLDAAGSSQSHFFE